MEQLITLTQIERQVIDLLMRTDGLSRFEVSQKLGGNAGTIARAVTRLVKKGYLVEEEEKSATVGRPKRPLSMNPEVGTIIGIDVEATNVRGVAIDFSRSITKRRRYSLKLGCRPSTAMKEVLRMYDELCAGAPQKSILGLGLGIPSPCDSETGTIRSYIENHSWDGYAMKSALESKLKCPIFAEHNIITIVLGENWFRFHGRIKNLINVLIRAGVAASYIINGAIYRGDRGMAGNISHLKVWPKGDLCECGQRGCIRQYTAAKSLERKMKEAGLKLRNGKNTILSLSGLAMDGDKRAMKIVKKAGQSLGIAIGHMINYMGVQQVIINSDLNNAGNVFLEPINSEVNHAVSSGDVVPNISFSTLEGYAGALGAAVMVLEKVCGIWEDT